MASPNNQSDDSLDNCVIPPAIPASELPNLLFRREQQAEREIYEYMEWQAPDEKVQHAERVATESVLGRRIDAWDVHTDQQRWWVMTSPINLYSQELFPSLDYAISFHVGITARVMSKPEPGVPRAEQAMLAPAWRRWEQAAEALEEADEAEEFQSVGMRCREALVTLAKSMASPEMVPSDEVAPKAADFIGWSELIANHVARGESAEFVRGYLKATSKSGWKLVSWLTHTSSATQADAIMAIEVTQHILATYGTAFFRHQRGIPDRCTQCGSYKVGLWIEDPRNPEAKSRLRCQICETLLDEPH